MRPLSARERRLLAIGLLILLIASLWALILAPVIDGFTERAQQRTDLSAAYERNSRLIAAIPALRRQTERQAAAMKDFVIASPNPALARAALRDRLRRDVTAMGGQVTALQDMPAPAGTVRASVQARMTMEQFQHLLVRMADTPPYLVTEGVRVSADRALETGHLDILDVRLEASIAHSPTAS